MRRIVAHKLKWDEEGVASTVGTIMALLVFLSFLSLIVNSYVPVWMKEAESSHMNVAYGQFGDLKASIDQGILFASMSQLAGQHYIPVTTFTPITLGVDGVPIFSAPTLGELVADQNAGASNSWFTYFPSKFSNKPALVNETAQGSVVLRVFNRYFISQNLIYENGAVIKEQGDGMILRAEPTFEVRIVNNTEQITVGMVSLLGYGTMQGTTTEGIHSKVVSVSTEEYSRVRTDVFLNLTGRRGLAWYGFYNATLNKAFGITPDKYKGCPNDYCYNVVKVGPNIIDQTIQSPYFKIRVQLNKTSLDYTLVVQLKNDYDNSKLVTMPIATLRVQKAIVNMAVGGLGALVDI